MSATEDGEQRVGEGFLRAPAFLRVFTFYMEDLTGVSSKPYEVGKINNVILYTKKWEAQKG